MQHLAKQSKTSSHSSYILDHSACQHPQAMQSPLKNNENKNVGLAKTFAAKFGGSYWPFCNRRIFVKSTKKVRQKTCK